MKAILIGAAAALMTAGASHAAIFYSNLNPADPNHFPGARYIQGEDEFGGINDPAYMFTSLISGAVTKIELDLSFLRGSVEVSLHEVAAGDFFGQPGTSLGQWQATGSGLTHVVISGISGVTLTAGQQYFLQVTPSETDTSVLWHDNSIGELGILWQCSGSNPTYTACTQHHSLDGADLGAFAVTGGVPEPATWTMMILGFGGAGAMLRRRVLAA